VNPFFRSLIPTAAVLAALCVVASIGAGRSWGGIAAGAAGLATVAALVLGIVLASRRRAALAAGVFAGMGLGVLGLMVTCFANMFA
jgi:hypothetical protein